MKRVAEETEVKVMISHCLSQAERVCIDTAWMGQLPRLRAGWKRADMNLEGKTKQLKSKEMRGEGEIIIIAIESDLHQLLTDAM